MLVDVSLRQAGRDGQCGVIDFSIITPAAESYCAGAAKEPLHAAKIREDAKILKYFQAYKNMDDIHFEPFVVESGGELGVRAQEIFKKICNLITQTTGQSGSSIAYFWKSRLLVTLAKKLLSLMPQDGRQLITNFMIQTAYPTIWQTCMMTTLTR